MFAFADIHFVRLFICVFGIYMSTYLCDMMFVRFFYILLSWTASGAIYFNNVSPAHACGKGYLIILYFTCAVEEFKVISVQNNVL